MDVHDTNASVGWQTYLELYCIFQAGKIEKDQLIKFWMKFFDKQMQGDIEEKVYMKLLEELVRGKSMDEPTEATKVFANTFKKMMKNANCLDEKDAIIRDNLQQAFREDTVDIQMLCSALGSQQLDSKFLQV